MADDDNPLKRFDAEYKRHFAERAAEKARARETVDWAALDRRQSAWPAKIDANDPRRKAVFAAEEIKRRIRATAERERRPINSEEWCRIDEAAIAACPEHPQSSAVARNGAGGRPGRKLERLPWIEDVEPEPRLEADSLDVAREEPDRRAYFYSPASRRRLER